MADSTELVRLINLILAFADHHYGKRIFITGSTLTKGYQRLIKIAAEDARLRLLDFTYPSNRVLVAGWLPEKIAR